MTRRVALTLTAMLLSTPPVHAQAADSPPTSSADRAARIAAEQARAKATVGVMDINKDGVVSPDEYRTAQLAQFARLDTNGDGKLTPDEIPGAGPGRGAPSGPIQLAGDINKDGALTQAEYAATADKEYKSIDKDWNNKITAVEMTTKVRTPLIAKVMGIGDF